MVSILSCAFNQPRPLGQIPMAVYVSTMFQVFHIYWEGVVLLEFLAVQDSSITDIVCPLVPWSVGAN